MTHTLTASDEEISSLLPAAHQYLVIAFDCAHPLHAPVRLLLDLPRAIIGRGSRREWRRAEDGALHIDLADSWISSAHALLTRSSSAEREWCIEDTGSKNGTFLNGVRLEQTSPLHDGDVLQIGNTIAVYRSLTHSGNARDDVAELAPTPTLPSTLNPPWSSDLTTLLRVARSSAPILLHGGTGTGKEVVARAIHLASGRSGRFVPVNCGAIVKTLVESELFGTRKGAFSGATEERLGLIRSADGGTLFLDEIAELPEASQVALLRVLQEHVVLPVGGTRAVPIDLRVVAATHEDLGARVGDGRFRADLHSRLSGHVAHLPRLRDRLEDIGLLVAQLLPRLVHERAQCVTFSRAAGRALFTYHWPYNVRELEQALNAALAIADDDQIDTQHLPERLFGARATDPRDLAPTPASACDEGLAVDEQASAERERIVNALTACAGNQTRAAKALGISRATLVNKLAIHRLSRPRKPGG